ncbi:WD40 repeat domain-containing protein [Smaragdicoccus niigatensis]|uniref:WD40 repeat domain-containing protein n=1 Tax=Smaragdicoccus niigatensis TaxID=359359 RepID=UPI0012DDF0DB|nr:WD40 repeat domain-containing protein [Smaragdicoccus niigatensis]
MTKPPSLRSPRMSAQSLRDKADSTFHAFRESRRSLQVTIAVLMIISIIAVVSAISLAAARTTESKRRELAVEARNEAWSRMAAAEAARLRYTDPALAAQFALAAYRLADTVEGTSALLDSTTLVTPSRLIGPPGATIVSASAGSRTAISMADGTVGLFTIGADGSLRELETIKSGGTSGAALVSINRNYLVRSVGSAIELWRLGDSATLAGRIETPGTVTALSLSGDGIAAAVGNDVLRWDITNPKAPAPLPPLSFGHPINGIAVNDSAHRIAAVSGDGTLTVWTGDQPTFNTQGDGFTAAAFNGDGTLLAAGSQSGIVSRWRFDGDAAQGLPVLTGLAGNVHSVAYSGNRLAAAAGTITQVWRDDLPESTMPSATAITSVAITADGATLVTGGENGTTQVWPIPAPLISNPNLANASLAVGTKGTKITVGDTAATVIDADHPRNLTAQPLPAMPEGQVPSGATATSADGLTTAVGTTSGNVVVWQRSAGGDFKLAGVAAMTHDPIAHLELSRSGKILIATTQTSNKAFLWDVAADKALPSIDVSTGTPTALGYDARSNRIAIGSNRDVAIYSLEPANNPSKQSSIVVPSTPTAVAFNPEGSLLAVGSAENEVLLYDAGNGELTGRMSAPAKGVQSVTFSPDGAFVAAGGRDEFVWIWDVTETDKPVRYATLRAYPGPVSDAVFVGDGYLAGAIDHVGVALWHFSAEDVAAELCSRGSTPVSEEEWRTHLPGVPLIETCLTSIRN